MRSIFFMAAILTAGCGQDNTCQTNAEVNRTNGSDCVAEADTKNPAETTFEIQGSVTSVFSVTVDGTQYQDIEAYYTASLKALPDRVKAAGYAGYTAKLEASLGFLDLVAGMNVFVQTTSARGYASATAVDKRMTFSIFLPNDAAGDTYQFRASKRIDISLTKGNDTKKICYNFSAVNFDVPYALADKPVILNNFTSEVTAYACQTETPKPSLEIPLGG